MNEPMVVQALAERVWLVGVQSLEDAPGVAEELLEELAELVQNLGWEILGKELVHLKRFHSEFLLGTGKVESIMDEAKAVGASMIILDHELSPSQQRNWEGASGLRVFDRQEVILDIFLERAKTKEAVLQVELACMEYTLPRLKRAWLHLSRQRGGGSTQRGEGETQLELDQRLVRNRITKLKRELKEVQRHREVQRSRRLKIPIPTAAIVGYTNAGKSSLLNALTHSHVLAEDKLFATLDPSTRRAHLPCGKPFLLTDTVGFIRRLPHRLVEAFKATLEESLVADFLIHVLDMTNPSVEAHYATTREVLKELGAEQKRTILVFNKIDRCSDPVLISTLRQRFPQAIFISAVTGAGLSELQSAIEHILQETGTQMTLKIPFEAYAWLHRLHEAGAVISEKPLDDGIWVIAMVPPALEKHLQPYKKAAQ